MTTLLFRRRYLGAMIPWILVFSTIFIVAEATYSQQFGGGGGGGEEEEQEFGLGGILLAKGSPTLTWSSALGPGEACWGSGWPSWAAGGDETQFGDIVGVTFSEDARDLYFIGRPSEAPLQIGHLIDYFAAALRSIYAGEPPEVSIDPPFIPLNLAERPKADMIVRLRGITQNNNLGWLLFEADRALKCLSLGQDNITQKHVRCNVPGFKSETALSLEYKVNRTAVWHRFWFEPARNHVHISLDRRTFLLDTELEVKTEYKAVRNGRLVAQGAASDPAAEAFAEYLTKNYEAFARAWIIADVAGKVNQRWAIFRELKVAAQLASLAQAIYDLNTDNNPNNDIPIDLSWWLAEYPLASQPTPMSTPGFTATAQRRRHLGHNKVAIQRARIFGGVSLAPKNRYVQNDPAAQGWGDAAAKAAATYDSLSPKRFAYRGQTVGLTDVPNAPAHRNTPHYRQTDLTTANLALERIYDFTYPQKKGAFGNGGRLAPLPRLHFAPRKIKIKGWGQAPSMVFLRPCLPRRSRRRQVPGHPAIVFTLLRQVSPIHARLTRSRNGEYQRRTLTYEGGNGLRLRFDGDLFTLTVESTTANEQTPGGLRLPTFAQGKLKTCQFKSDGRLLMAESAQGVTRYEYEDERLIQITHSGGDQIDLGYDNQGRVVSAKTQGRRVTYQYDERGNLVDVADSNQRAISYAYDPQNRLIRVRDGNQNLLAIKYPADGGWPRLKSLQSASRLHKANE